MLTSGEKIRSEAIKLLGKKPEGIRYMELVRLIANEFPEIPENTVHGSIWDLDKQLPNEVVKPARGLFKLRKYEEEGFLDVEEKVDEVGTLKPGETDFYKPFADWLVKELEECTKAIPLGGNIFKDKWGTPDVVGIREPKRSDIIKLPTEIVSAEIKADAAGLVTAFGQACAYKLFSHKAFIVVPKQSHEEDISKVDALCRIFGIGFILFNNIDPKNPEFEIRVRPRKHEPDMFYVNKYMKIIEDKLF